MKPKMESNTASVTVIGVDIGKEVFHLVGLGVDGKIAFRMKIRRLALKDTFEQLPEDRFGARAAHAGKIGALQHRVIRTKVCCGAKPVGADDLGERPLSGRKRTIPFDASAVPYAPSSAVRGTAVGRPESTQRRHTPRRKRIPRLCRGCPYAVERADGDDGPSICG
jgi:hypothetical protein